MFNYEKVLLKFGFLISGINVSSDFNQVIEFYEFTKIRKIRVN